MSLGAIAEPPTLGQVDALTDGGSVSHELFPGACEGRGGLGETLLYFGALGNYSATLSGNTSFSAIAIPVTRTRAHTYALTDTLSFFIARKSISLVTLHVSLFPGVKIAGSLNRASLVQGPS